MNQNRKVPVFRMLFLLILIIIPAVTLYASVDNKQIFILHSYHQGYKWTDDIQRGIKEVLHTDNDNVDLRVEYLDTKHISDDAYLAEMYEAFQLKYQHTKIDLIISSDDSALNFLLKYADSLFPCVPVVFCGANFFDIGRLANHEQFTGVSEEADIKGTLDIALKLHPDIRKVVVVNDTTITGRILHKRIEHLISEYPNLVFTLLEDYTMDDIRNQVSRLSPDSLVIITIFTSDKAGNFFEYDTYTSLISESSAVPVYGTWDFSLGYGIVGGKLTNGYTEGLRTARIARRILLGESPSDIPVVKQMESRYMFDSNLLQRFQVSISDLPQGSVVINQIDNLYRLYKRYVWSASFSLLFMLIIIVTLTVNIIRRRRMERALHHLNRELRAISNCNQILLRAEDEQSLLDEICRIVCDEAGYRMAWVGYVEHDEAQTVRPVAWAGFEDGYLAAANITWADTEYGRGPSGTAIRSGQSKCIQDFASDPHATPWSQEALQRGYRSSIALPLKNESADTIGVLNIYSTVPNAFTLDETRLLEELSGDLAFGIITMRTRADRKRAEEALQEERRLFIGGPNVAFKWKAAEGWPVEYVSPNIMDQFGYAPADLISGEISYASIIHPDDLSRVADEVLKCSEAKLPCFEQEYRIARKDGEYRWIYDFTVVIKDLDGVITHYQGHISDITERKRAEAALQESEKKYRQIIDTTNEGIWILDEDCNTIFANTRLAELLGIQMEEMIGQNLESFLFEADKCDHARRMEIRRQGQSEHYERRFRRKDGQAVWTIISATPLFDANNRYCGSFGMFTDITERKWAEDALRQSQSRYQSLFEDAPIALIEADYSEMKVYLDTLQSSGITDYYNYFESHPEAVVHCAGLIRFNDFNKAALKLIRAKDKTELSARPQILFAPESISSFKEALIALATGKLEFQSEIIAGTVSDERITAVLQLKIVPGYEMTFERVLISMQDISGRKKAEKALEESEERWRLLVEYHPAGSAIHCDGKIIYINKVCLEMVGANSKEELVGREILDFVHSDFHPIVISRVKAMLETGSFGEPIEEKFLRLNGESYDVEVTAIPITYMGKPAIQTVFWDITKRKWAEEALRHRVTELEALHTVSASLRTVQTKEDALPILLEEALAALETENGIIWLYQSDNNELRNAAARGWLLQLSESPMKPGEGIVGTVFINGQNYPSKEFRSDPLTRDTTRDQIPPGWGGVCLPIRTGTVTIGVLLVAVPSAQQITKEQSRLLDSLAEIAGATLHRMSLFEETTRQLNRLQALHRIDQAISASTDLRMTLNVLLEQVSTQLNVDATDVLLLNPFSLSLEFAAGRGFRTRAVESIRIQLGENFARRVALERRAVKIDNPAQMHENPKFAALWAGEEFAAYYAVPLIVKGLVKGVLELFHRSPLNAGNDWVSFLETLAGQAAIAIENAQLFDHLQRSNIDLALAYDATIEGWARAMDLRDKETEGHTQRVTELTEKLARAMHINESEIVHLRRGALLHDIGKMGVPDRILLKPSELNDKELIIMRQHPQYAFDMLAPIAFLRPAMDIPYCHHEKWDGTGYPRGIKGENIPLAARMFAVIDVYDALTSDRAYRAAWSREKALQHIKSLSNTHFDPNVVELFLKKIREWTE